MTTEFFPHSSFKIIGHGCLDGIDVDISSRVISTERRPIAWRTYRTEVFRATIMLESGRVFEGYGSSLEEAMEGASREAGLAGIECDKAVQQAECSARRAITDSQGTEEG